MKLNKKCKIEAAVSDDDSRLSILNPYLRDGHIYATSGKVLVKVPVERDDKDVDGHIDASALVEARKDGNKRDPLFMVCLKENLVMHHMQMPRKDEGQFPNCNAVIPQKPTETHSKFRVSVDVNLLVQVAKAIGTTKLKLCFQDSNSPIFVVPTDHPDNDELYGSLAVVMPIFTEE